MNQDGGRSGDNNRPYRSNRPKPTAQAQRAREFAETFFKPSHLGYHADHPHRRIKTLAELIEGCEWYEIADRCAPGRPIGGAHR